MEREGGQLKPPPEGASAPLIYLVHNHPLSLSLSPFRFLCGLTNSSDLRQLDTLQRSNMIWNKKHAAKWQIRLAMCFSPVHHKHFQIIEMIVPLILCNLTKTPFYNLIVSNVVFNILVNRYISNTLQNVWVQLLWSVCHRFTAENYNINICFNQEN